MVDLLFLETQSKATESPSMTVLLMGGMAKSVSPGTLVDGGNTPGLNDLTKSD